LVDEVEGPSGEGNLEAVLFYLVLVEVDFKSVSGRSWNVISLTHQKLMTGRALVKHSI